MIALAMLIVSVTGLKNDDGVARMALYNNEAAYTESQYGSAGALRRCVTPIHNGTAQCEFRQLPYGGYGVKTYHDKNNSGRLETNFFGVPKQGYGFSNNPRNLFGLPTWNQIEFGIHNIRTKITIHIQGDD